MKYLETLIAKINSQDKQINFDPKSNDIVFTENKDSIPFSDLFFDHLNYSILLGEYVFTDEIQPKLDTLISATEDLINELGEPNENISLIEDIKICKYAVIKYKDLSTKVKCIFETSEKQYLFSQITQTEIPNSQSSFRENYDLFYLNLKLAYCDHHFGEVRDKVLIRIYNSLKLKKWGKKYLILLQEKTAFLLIKLLHRRTWKDQSEYYYLDNSIERPISNFMSQNSIYGDNYYNLTNYYELSPDWKSVIKKDYQNLKTKTDEKRNYIDYYKLIKYYKDVTNNPTELSNISQSLLEQYNKPNDTHRPIDRYALGVCVNFAYNNLLSLLCDTSADHQEVKKTYDKITEIQEKTEIKNFFPQYKYLKYLIKNLDKKFHTKEVYGNLEDCLTSIKECKSVLDSYKTNISWCRKFYNYEYQLPYRECLIKTQNSEIEEIFIYSSFFPPLKKEDYEEKFEEYRKEVSKFENSISVFENLKKDIDEYKKAKDEITELKEDGKNREVRSMEILGIFTAIVTFVAGSISSFRLIETAYQAALFTLSFAFSMSSFVLITLLVTRKSEAKKYWITLFLFLFIAIITWNLLITNEENLSKQRDNQKFNNSTDLQ